MKKTLLAILALGISGVAFAQTNCDVAENLVTANIEGFEYKFKRGQLDKDVVNCLPAGGGTSQHYGDVFGGNTAGFNGNIKISIHPTDDKLIIETDQAVSLKNIFCRFPVGNCLNMGGSSDFDFRADRRCHMIISNDVAITLDVMAVILSGNTYQEIDGNSTINGGARPSYTFAADTRHEVCDSLSQYRSNGTATLLPDFANPLGWAFQLTTSGAAKITIEKLAFGDAASRADNYNQLLASNLDAQIDNSLISVYPTPSTDELNVDLSKLSADAELKLVSSNGQTVYTSSATNALNKINVSEFTSGLYVLQITSEGKTGTKKVVIK